MDNKLQDQIMSILNDVEDMNLATLRPDGYPQVTTVTFVNDGLALYFMTTEESQKVQNIDKNNKISLTVNRPYTDWQQIEGLSMGGTARFVNDPEEIERVGHLMFKKLPNLASFIPANDGNELAYLRIDPKIITVLDYKKGFGHTEEMVI
jgi:general stress protein 26